jgi:hypothetical protein
MGLYLEVAGTTRGKARGICEGGLVVPVTPFENQFEKFENFEKEGAWEYAPAYRAEVVQLPLWEDIPEDKMLVVVVENMAFEAAALVTDATEYKQMTGNAQDYRPRTYILIDKDVALRAAC